MSIAQTSLKMKRKIVVAFTALILMLSLFMASTPTRAAGDSLTFIGFLSTGCANAATGFLLNFTPAVSGNHTFHTVVSAGGNVYMNESFISSQQGTMQWHLYFANSGGSTNAAFPLPRNTSISVALTFGSASYNFSFVCGTSVTGPPIPTGFVLRTIICDVAVFANAGGTPVSTGEKITNMQTWFVSPTSVKDNKGNAWTEIFVGGYIDGFIPSQCVAGKPAGYAGN